MYALILAASLMGGGPALDSMNARADRQSDEFVSALDSTEGCDTDDACESALISALASYGWSVQEIEAALPIAFGPLE